MSNEKKNAFELFQELARSREFFAEGLRACDGMAAAREMFERHDELETKVQDLAVENANLEAKNDSLRREAANLQARVDNLKSQYEQAKLDWETLKSTVKGR
jgi:phage shock protein A